MYNVVIFGTGKSKEIVESGLKNNVNIIAYIDNDKLKWNKELNGKMILSPDKLNELEYDYIIIASQFNEEIYKQLLHLNVDNSKIFQYSLYTMFLYNDVKGRLYEAIRNKDNTEVIITGISYVFKGIKPSVLKKSAYNLACWSQDLYYDYKSVKWLLENNKNEFKTLRNVIIGLSYYSFEYDMSLSAMKDRTMLYYEVMGDNHNYKNVESSISNKNLAFSIAKQIFKFNDSNKLMVDWMLDKKNIYTLNEEKGKKQALLDGNKNYPKTVKENIQIFKDYLDLLKENNVKPIVVVCPVSKYYSKHFPNRLKEEFMNIISETRKENGFQFIDYFESEEFSDDDFYDVSHLNAQGAEKFTGILNKIIQW